MATDTRDNEGRASLHPAASNGDIETVRILISAGADIKERDAKGATALHLAVECGHTETAKVLIDAESAAAQNSGVEHQDTIRAHKRPCSLERGHREPQSPVSRTPAPSTKAKRRTDNPQEDRPTKYKVYLSDKKCRKCRVWNRGQATACSSCGTAFDVSRAGDSSSEWEGVPFITIGILVVSLAIMVLMQREGGTTQSNILLDFGAMYTPLIADGEYWRMVTSMFVHIGWMHFIRNAIALAYYGFMAEPLYGSGRFVILYLGSGLCGGVLSYLMLENTINAGASGAIFGLLGALLAFSLKNWYAYDESGRPVIVPIFRNGQKVGEDKVAGAGRRMLPGLLVIMFINLAFSLGPGINVWSHLGGLIGGSAIGVMLMPSPSNVD